MCVYVCIMSVLMHEREHAHVQVYVHVHVHEHVHVCGCVQAHVHVNMLSEGWLRVEPIMCNLRTTSLPRNVA